MPVGGYKYPTTLRMKIAESSVVGDDRNMLQPELRLLEILTSVVAWPSINNTLTLKCNQGNVILQQSEDQCDFKPKCVLRYTNKSALFFCSRCKCSCKKLASQNFIKDPVVLQQRIEETKKILEVKRSELSAYKRKKISSHDGRASSTGIGMTLGVGVITFVIGAIVCSDLLTCRARRRRRAPRKA
uniref:Uncharacterized protein n=1 Tax=Magallana gigas TaxID=29159 RepID=K1QIR9_MAGGI